MQRFAPVPEGGGQRGSEAGRRDAQEIRQAGGRGNLLRRQAVEDHRQHGDEEQAHGEPLHHLRHHEGHVAGIGRERGAHEVGNRVQGEGGGREHARIEAAHQVPYQQRGQDGADTARGGHQARPGRRVAQVALQPQRHQHDVAEEDGVSQAQRDGAEREAARLEQAQVDDGMLFGELPDQPGGEGNEGDDAAG